MRVRKHTLFLLLLGLVAWPSASASEFECRNGAQMRRVEARSGAVGEDLACEVRYWRNAGTQGDGEVLWRASQDADFCDAKAAELVARLEAGGWRCAPVDRPAPSAPMPEAAAAAPAGSAPPLAPKPPAPQAPAPVEPTPGAIEHAEVPAASEPADRAASEVARPAVLEQVVAQTLRNVQQMYGGEFRAEGSVFGDLDGDGREDAAVLVTYQADPDDYVQYLVAYLFDGETFQSTDTKNVGGRFHDALHAEIRDIVDQAIVVDLQSLDADEDCCETRRAAFVLQEGELVEVGVPLVRARSEGTGAQLRRADLRTAHRGLPISASGTDVSPSG